MTNLYIDIETIPDQRPGALAAIREKVTAPARYKKAESIDAWLHENAQLEAEQQYGKTGLNGISGEICSISWALDDGGIKGMIREPGMAEGELLSEFFADVVHNTKRGGQGAHPRITWIGHNVIDFDLRFLKQRCIVNSVLPQLIIPADARHGSPQVFDTMKAWCGWKGFVSQDALCEALGIKGKEGMHGADVWPAYQAGEFAKILDYNKDDVEIVRELHRRMAWG